MMTHTVVAVNHGAEHADRLDHGERVRVPRAVDVFACVGVAFEVEVVADAVGEREAGGQAWISQPADGRRRDDRAHRLQHVLVAALHAVELIRLVVHARDGVEVREGHIQPGARAHHLPAHHEGGDEG
eukprot:CAMPEP_0119355574 /NCGR_PEP_ID=MMETSP1334-20130426/4379_1 /TAXON_ID=127549 /ORGANISM="Calcidiscus leptoporus, Strain RCC1130" /LENGTH=127 /DNA_ID=CAMNT_0007369421 /DNA_START=317 /DNA_END=699 /DNA_ORIENTATION=-